METRTEMNGVLIANRGEVAVRIARTAAARGIRTVGVFAADDADSSHVRATDVSVPLCGEGVPAYLDIDALVGVALAQGCNLVHPGYGFLSESPDFARACESAGLVLIGPSATTLDIFGDKVRARDLARLVEVPILEGTAGSVTLDEAQQFFDSLGPGSAAMVKANAGGGGRGIRVVKSKADLNSAYRACQQEALRAFGRGDVYLERYLPNARHIEVQIIGDGTGHVAHLGERDCSIQRMHQKIVEVAPSPSLTRGLREKLCAAAVEIATAEKYTGLGTFEFLVDTASEDDAFFFMEANPRLQVEHTVTEQVTGLDLVGCQFDIAQGRTLDELDLPRPDQGKVAIQLRINAERSMPNGLVMPSSGTLEIFRPPIGAGIRVDTAAVEGQTINPRYDSLLAKVIVTSESSDFAVAADAARDALDSLEIDGIDTNADVLRRVVVDESFRAGEFDTAFLAGAKFAGSEPTGEGPTSEPHPAGPTILQAQLNGSVVEVAGAVGSVVPAGAPVVVVEAMKMHHPLTCPQPVTVRELMVKVGDVVTEGQPVASVQETFVMTADQVLSEGAVEIRIRADLSELAERRRKTTDSGRPAVTRSRHASGRRTARENLSDLCDEESFQEYGGLAIAAQRQRRDLEDLIDHTPADGLIGGTALVNGELVDPVRAACMVISYDYTVMAGTQGTIGHRKQDRLFEIALRNSLPIVLFAEGGGGRPGETDDMIAVAKLDGMTFHEFGKLSGQVPLIGIASGRCFAGNAALLGSCDVVIATAGSSIGMGGPAMIEGGGLGVVAADEVGPMDVQTANGVVDILVHDDLEAVAVAKKYLSYFQGPLSNFESVDQTSLRSMVPENRLRVYDVRNVIDTLADTGSVLELRRFFGSGLITALIRIEGQPFGLVANDPAHLGGAIDADGADKFARFLQLCDAHGLGIITLCDTPGFMVGPDEEKKGTVRHFNRLFVIGAHLRVPLYTVVLRKAYGLGAMAMGGGSLKVPVVAVSWPTGEFGGMGLEGAVRLGFRKELDAVIDEDERTALFGQLVSDLYERGKALNVASVFEIDDVIDPAETRRRIMAAAVCGASQPNRSEPGTRYVDTW